MIRRGGDLAESGQGHQVGELLAPGVLDPVRQQDDLVRRQRVDGALVVGDQDDRPAVRRQRLEHLTPTDRVEVVGRLVEQQDVRRRANQAGQRQPGLLPARQRADRLAGHVTGEQKRAQAAPQLAVRGVRGHGLRLGYYAQEHETLDTSRNVLENMRAAAPDTPDGELRRSLGAFLFTGDMASQPVGTLAGGEKTRLALAGLVCSAANVLLLDEPTNNLDPISRGEVLKALAAYRGAVVLVTHDEGAVDSLAPDKVILLPDGIEDTWSEELADLVALA